MSDSKLKCPWCGGEADVQTSKGDTVFRWWCQRSYNECGASGHARDTEAEARADCEVVIVRDGTPIYGKSLIQQVMDAGGLQRKAAPISEVEIFRAAAAIWAAESSAGRSLSYGTAISDARNLAAVVKEGE